MCGVPYHAVESYLTRLLRKGYRIAICDQMEDPKLTKKIVRREVTRVLSPGTALDAALGQEQNNFLAALFESGLEPREPAVAPWRCSMFPRASFAPRNSQGATARQQAVDEIAAGRRRARCCWRRARSCRRSFERIPARTRVEDWVWTRDFAVPLVERQLNVRSLEGFGLDGHRGGGDCGGRGAALCAHHAEERGAAHRFS